MIPLRALAITPLLLASLAFAEEIAKKLPETVVVATRPVSADDFRQFAPLYEDLAKDPSTKAELEFLVASKNRILGIADRGDDIYATRDSFLKKFGAPEKAHPALRTAMVYMLSRIPPHLIGKEKGLIERLLAEPREETPIQRALRISANARWQEIQHENIGSARDVGALMKSREMLLKCIEPMPSGISDDTQLLLISPLYNPKQNPITKSEGQRISEAKTIAWLESLPAEKKRAAHEVILGVYYKNYAWIKRGSAFALSTTSAQFKDFDKYLRISADHFREAIRKNPKTHAAYVGLLAISVASTEIAGGDEDHWYALAETIHPDDETTAKAYIFASQPRWGKPPENLLRFVSRILQAARYETSMPLQSFKALTSLIADATSEEDKTALIRRYHETVVEVSNHYLDDRRKGLKRVVGENGLTLDSYVKFNAVSAFAAYPGDEELIPKIHDETNNPKQNAAIDKTIAAHLASGGKFAQQIKLINEARALESAYVTNRLEARKELELHSDPKRIQSFLEEAEKLGKLDPTLLKNSSLSRILPVIRDEKKFVEGATVTLAMRAQDTFVGDSAQGWSIGKDSATAKDLGAPSSIYGTYLQVFAPPFETTVKISAVKLAPDAWFGIHVGRTLSGEAGRSFVLNKNSVEWAVLPGKTDSIFRKLAGGKLDALPETSTLRLRVFNHGYAFFLNDKKIYSSRDESFQSRSISLGCAPLLLTRGSLVYGEPTVRKLKPDELSADEADWMKDPES